MSDKNIKGPLLNPKKRQPLKANAIEFNEDDPFKFKKPKIEKEETAPRQQEKVAAEESTKAADTASKSPEVPKKPSKKVIAADEPPTEQKKRVAVVGKYNSTKTIKVPTDLHTQINILGKFMDESKVYAILDKLIDNYVESQLTDRQKKQFFFMSSFNSKDADNE